MKISRTRFTLRRLMIAVGVAAALLAGLIEVPRLERRRSSRAAARAREAVNYRREASRLRAAIAEFRSCPVGHPNLSRRWAVCRRCGAGWAYVSNPEVATRDRAIPILEEAAEIMERWARKCDEASRSWRARVAATPAERAELQAAAAGGGDLYSIYPLDHGTF